MATINIPLNPLGAHVSDVESDHAESSIRRKTGDISIPSVEFKSNGDEFVHWQLQAIRYGSGNLTLDVDWYADIDSTGLAKWAGQIAVITPNTDTQDIETKTFAAAATNSVSHLGTTTQRLHRTTVVITALDGLAADDWFAIRVYRNSSDATNDTLIGDLYMVHGNLSYSDT